MSGADNAWDDVSARVTALGRRLKEEIDRGGDGEATADHSVSADLRATLERLASTVEEAVDGVARAAKDDSVQDDLRGVGQSLSNALAASLKEVGGEIRELFDRADGAGGDGTPGNAGMTVDAPTQPAVEDLSEVIDAEILDDDDGSA